MCSTLAESMVPNSPKSRPPATKDLFCPFRSHTCCTQHRRRPSSNTTAARQQKFGIQIKSYSTVLLTYALHNTILILYIMSQYRLRRSASPISYPTREPRWERSNTRSPPEEILYRGMNPVPASTFAAFPPELYIAMFDSGEITEAPNPNYRDTTVLDIPSTPIYVSSSPVPEGVTHQHEEGATQAAPVYVSSSPIQPSIEFDEPGSPVYLPRGLRLYGDERDTAQYIPRGPTPYRPSSSPTPAPSLSPPHYTYTYENMNNIITIPPPAEATYGDTWTPNSQNDQPLIWSSEVNIQILPNSSPYHPSTPSRTPDRTLSPTSPSMDFVPVPAYDNPEWGSISPRYRTQEDQDRDYFLLETLRDPEIQAMETLDCNYLWRRRWVVDYGSDADDEGEVGGY